MVQIGEDLTKASTKDNIVFLEVEYEVNSTAKGGEEHVDEKAKGPGASASLRPEP